jgi:hypothetical protein
LKYEHDNQKLVYRAGVRICNKTHTAVAGALECIVTRRDVTNKLDGTNYLCISIDNSHTFGASLQPSADAPDATIYVGSTGTTLPANAIIEGLTFYRRVLFDGTYGIDAGNGDEIELIYAAGAGKKPEEVTGGQDICFQLPTDGATGQLNTGTGEAHSFPNASSVLTDSFMQTTFGSSAWSASGAVDTGPADIASAANKIFNWGYEWIGDADEGVENSLTSLAAGQNYTARVIAHEAAGGDLRLTITDDTNTATILTEDFATTDRDTPGVLEVTFELPTVARHGVAADCTAITIKILTIANNKTGYAHQCVLMENNVDNPSMEGTYEDESGGGGGTINLAPGWDNHNCETDGSDTLDESADAHSGSKSQQINVDQNAEGIKTSSDTVFLANKYYLISAWIKGTSGSLQFLDDGADNSFFVINPAASWTKYSVVWLVPDNSRLFIQSSNPANILIDDVSIIELDDVSLTVTPTSEANSIETAGLRVDGLDQATVDITGELKATEGKVRFDWTPRHGDGDFNKFGNESLIIDILKSGNDRIAVYAQSNDQLRAYTTVNGAAQSDTWDAAGITAGTTYLVEIEYGGTTITISFDGTIRLTMTYAGGVDFGLDIPDTAYIGTDGSNVEQGDAAFGAPT